MEFTLSEDQLALRDSVREVLSDRFPLQRVAAMADGDGFDPASWKEIAGLGWPAVSVAEDAGGLGMGFVEEAVVLEELGRGLFPGPFLSSVTMALPVLSGSPQFADRVLSGGSAATVALGPADGEPDVVAERHADAWRLSGAASFVPDLEAADLVVVAAEAPDEPGLYVVERDGDGAMWESLPTVDGTRRQGRIEFENVPATQLVTGEDAGPAMDSIQRRALAGIAAESVGVAQRALDLGVQHAGDREQFGRKIGVYQAVSHRLADVFVEVEGSRSLVLWAAWAVENGSDDMDVAVAGAKASATEAAVRACEVSIQVHGGIGFTWEHPLHRLYKRALGNAAFLGWPSEHRARIASALLD